MINNERLNDAILNVKTDLVKKFNSVFDLKPYYCGMGYVGIEILLDENTSDIDIENIEKYYQEIHGDVFFDFKLTKGDTTDEIKPSEILYVGKDGPYRPLDTK